MSVSDVCSNAHFNHLLQSLIFFYQQVKSENPNIVFKDMGAILGEKWKAFSP